MVSSGRPRARLISLARRPTTAVLPHGRPSGGSNEVFRTVIVRGDCAEPPSNLASVESNHVVDGEAIIGRQIGRFMPIIRPSGDQARSPIRRRRLYEQSARAQAAAAAALLKPSIAAGSD